MERDKSGLIPFSLNQTSFLYTIGIIILLCPKLRETVALKEEDDLLKFFDSLSIMPPNSLSLEDILKVTEQSNLTLQRGKLA